MIWHAAWAAMPLRSAPEEAAVAEVFGHLAGRGGGDPNIVDVGLELLRHHLGHLGVEALAHLGAAVVQVDAAVRVDMDQRPRLIVLRGGEGDAELHRRQRQPALDDAAPGVVLADRLAPAPIVRALLQLADDLGRDVVLHRLVVGRHVAVGGAVEVELPDLERVLADGVGDLLQ